MLDNTSGFCLQLFRCNILQIFIFDHIYFLAKDVFFLPLHWLAISTLTPCTNWSIVLHWMYYWSDRGARAHDPPLSLALYFRFVQAVRIARSWFHNRFISPFTLHRDLKIRITRPRNRPAFTRITIRHIYFAWCTHAWLTRSHDQNRSVYGRWLTKLQLGPFSRRKKAQRGIPSTLYLFQCVIWGV